MEEIIKKLHLDKIERHIFLCCDQVKPKCCSREDSLKSWQYLKLRLKELGIDQPSAEYNTCVFRTKADCLRVCCDGPILLVYPDGIWYRHATPEVIELIIQQHLLKNQLVEEYIFYRHSLPFPEITTSALK